MPGEPIGLHCPECGELAVFTFAEQAFCANDGCRILMWDPTMTREEMAAEGVHEISPGPESRGGGQRGDA
jgi:hypothetical protein